MIFSLNGVIYQQNGIAKKTKLPYMPTESFDIYEELDNPLINYNYPGDSLSFMIESEAINLRNHIRKLYFPNDDEYNLYSKVFPIFAHSVGYNSDETMSKTSFERLITSYFSIIDKQKQEDSSLSSEMINKYMYLTDVLYILDSIQNITIGANENFVDYFRRISCVDNMGHWMGDGIFTIVNGKTYQLSSILGDYFVKLHSILDLLKKLAYEIEHPVNEFSKYKKLKSHSILYEKHVCIGINNRKGTLFDKDSLINMISTIRNEIIHNGSWEDIPKVYLNIKNNSIIEKYMLFPDIESNGNLVTYVNRRHFYSSSLKVNNIFPVIHISFLYRMLQTIVLLNYPNMTDDELKDYIINLGVPNEVIEKYKWE